MVKVTRLEKMASLTKTSIFMLVCVDLTLPVQKIFSLVMILPISKMPVILVINNVGSLIVFSSFMEIPSGCSL
jgi:hypothetical protein